MTNKVIEELATTAVKKSILLTKVLDQYISENDKEPSWDGNVYIYNNEKKTKRNFIGRVPVQIKGKQSDMLTVDSFKFSVQIEDLKSYIRDSGVIYFVVLISNDGQTDEIFYNSLPPIKIKQILSNTKNTSTISLEFEKLPSDIRDIVNLFMDFHTHSQRQISFANTPIPSLEELEKQYGQIEIVHTMNAYGYTNNRAELLQSFLDRETYEYAKVDEILLPLSDVGILCAIAEGVPQSIKVNDKEYYTSFIRMYTKNRRSIKIGNSLEIFIKEQGGSMTLNIKPANMLSDRLKDTEFLIDAFNSKNMSINGVELDLSPSNLNLENLNISKMCDHYKYCTRIRKLLDILNIDQDLNLSKLTEAEQRDLFHLISAFVDGELIKHKTPNDSKYLFFKIQQLGISIYAKESVDGSSDYEYINVFSGKLAFSSSEHSQPTYPFCCILKKEHYIKFSNINYSQIIFQYKQFAETNPDIYSQANLDVLQMLLAYDECKKSIIINTAIEIMQWILQHGENDNRSKAIYQINYLQAIARLRDLSGEEQETLITISMSDEVQEDIKFAANVLLKQLPSAKAYLQKLEPHIIEQIKEFPIYNIFKKMNTF